MSRTEAPRRPSRTPTTTPRGPAFPPLALAFALALVGGAPACRTPEWRRELAESDLAAPEPALDRDREREREPAPPFPDGGLPSAAAAPAGHFLVIVDRGAEDAARPEELDALAELGPRLARLLGGDGPPPPSRPIPVYLFRDQARQEAAARVWAPRVPNRRAMFLADRPPDETENDREPGPQGPPTIRRAVFARGNPHLGEDLLHEGTHALLHAGGWRPPLWLDEGLAECLEEPDGADAPRFAHRDRLLAALDVGDWRPDLERLRRLDPDAELSALDYAEAWAWTRFLLDDRDRGRAWIAARARAGDDPRQNPPDAADPERLVAWLRGLELRSLDRDPDRTDPATRAD